jgi:hypothetical protein
VNPIDYLNYIYSDAPILKQVTKNDLKIILKCETYDNIICYVEKMIFSHRHGNLIDYFCNFIVNHYKNSVPNKQSIWVSDEQRQSYITREHIGQNKNPEWIYDKGGCRISEYIVKPIFIFTNDALKKYVILQKDTINDVSESASLTIIDKMHVAVNILTQIELPSLCTNVLKQMAKHFVLKKSKD